MSPTLIKPNDTLERLAARNPALTPGYIASKNGVEDAGQIKAGSTIMIPTDGYIEKMIRRDYLTYSVANSADGVAVPESVRNFDIYGNTVSSPYGRFGSMEALQQAAKAEYQKQVDAGYARGVELWDAGELEGRNRNQAIGTFMDGAARDAMRDWFNTEKIEQNGRGPAQVYVNRRLYDENDLGRELIKRIPKGSGL